MVHTAESSLSSIVDRLRPRVDAALKRYADLPDGCPAKLREAIGYSLLAPGKRLRPMLVLLAAEACEGRGDRKQGIRDRGQGTPRVESQEAPDSQLSPLTPHLSPLLERALPAACAVEMVHAYSLVHDDLPAMDDDDLRRGRATCHRKFGEATAILAGDALLTLAFEVLAKDIRPPALAAACCAELAVAAGACQLVGGQADDMKSGVGREESGEGEEVPNPPGPRRSPLTSHLSPLLESIHRRKTGAVICVSLRLGAMVAGADASQLDALERYGRSLGLAFQITDDLLDVRGSEDAVGKRVGKDSPCGKLTFPMLLGVDESLRRSKELVEDACRALGPLNCYSRNAAGGLEAVARYVLERNR